MKKIALTILTSTFIIALFSVDTTAVAPKMNDSKKTETAFRSSILGQAGQISNPDFNFKKEDPSTQNASTIAIPGREELIKLSDEIRQKTEKIKNLKFDPVFIKDEKFRNLVELEINLEDPNPIGVKNPFLDFKFRNQVKQNLKINNIKDASKIELNDEVLVDPILDKQVEPIPESTVNKNVPKSAKQKKQ